MPKLPQGSYQVELSAGLEGQDDNLDILTRLFEQLQVATVETADPHLDLITFASSAYYFAVIMEHYIPPLPEPVSDEEEREAETSKRTAAVEKAIYEKAEIEKRLKKLHKRKNRRPPQVPSSSSFLPPSSSIPPPPPPSDLPPPYSHPLPPPRSAPVIIPASMWASPSLLSVSKPTDGGPATLHPVAPSVAPLVPATNNEPHKRFTTFPEVPSFSPWGPVTDDDLNKQEDLWKVFNIKWEDPLVPANVASSLFPLKRQGRAVGIVYLTSSQNFEDPLHVGELNIGIILVESARGKGYARRAIEMVAQKAFEEAKCHRLQALLLNHVAKDRALCLFTEMRFGHEGTRRRSFFSPMEQEWKDVTYMAILDTDWVLGRSRGISSTMRTAPKSLWDELFARHEREREELLRWETSTLRRSSSNATLRAPSPVPTALPVTSSSEVEVDSEMSDRSESPRLSQSQKGKRKADTPEENAPSSSFRGHEVSDSDSEADVEPSSQKRKMSLPAEGTLNPFVKSEDDDIGLSDYDSAASWDAMEWPSSSDEVSDSDESSFFDVEGPGSSP